MLNYIKAELQKVLHRRGIYVLLVLLLLCMAPSFMFYSYGGFSSLTEGISVTMVVGMLAVPLLVQLVDGGTADILRNELSFGLRRGTVYRGKLCTALLLRLVFCLVPVGGSLADGWLLLPQGEPEEVLEGLVLVGFYLAGALLIWCGMFVPCHILALVVRSSAAQTAGYRLMFFMEQPMLVFLAVLLFGVCEVFAPFTLFTAVVLPYSLPMPALLNSWLIAQYQLWCWAIGLGWVTASTGLGLLLFDRRDVHQGEGFRVLIVCILLALLCAGLVFWVQAQRRSLREAAYRSRVLKGTESTARVRLAVPSNAAEGLLSEVNRLLKLRRADRTVCQAKRCALRQQTVNVSHNLRISLTSILGYLQFLEDPGLTEREWRKYLVVIVGWIRALQSLITSFYDLSQLEGGEYLPQREKADLYTSLSGLLVAFYNNFTDEGFDMEVELAEGLPQAQADAGAVLRIFTNLVRNASKHGEGRVEIRLYQEGGQAANRSSNETHALTAEDVPHVFDRFFTPGKMRAGRGTGLGLAITKTLTRQMDY